MGQLEDAWERDAARKQRTLAIAGWTAKIGAVVLVLGLGFLYRDELFGVASDQARQAIESAGFSDITLSDRDFMACEDGERSRHFRARNPLGKMVEGTVCCGARNGKACTLRW